MMAPKSLKSTRAESDKAAMLEPACIIGRFGCYRQEARITSVPSRSGTCGAECRQVDLLLERLLQAWFDAYRRQA